MKKTLAVTLAIVFVLSFAVPVFAQSMTHNASYKMDGDIDITKQVGHLCNTGAEMKQTISGEGVMDKIMDVHMVKGKLTVADDQDWVTAEDAVRNLTVTSAIELCAPPKHEWTGTKWLYGEDTLETVREELDLFEFMFYAYDEGLTAQEIWENHLLPTIGNQNTQIAYDYDQDGNVIGATVWNEYDQATWVSLAQFEAYYAYVMEQLGAHGHLINPAVIADLHSSGEYFGDFDAFLAGAEVYEERDYNFDLWGELDTYKMVETGVEGAGWSKIKTDQGEFLPAPLGYQWGWEDSPTFKEYALMQAQRIGDGNLAAAIIAAANNDEIYELLAAAGIDAPTEWWDYDITAISKQIWAVQVEADPGFSGGLTQNFEAAYGHHSGEGELQSPEAVGPSDSFWFVPDPTASSGYRVVSGADYVGNYFDIEQMARTSQGTVQRYIDISSPFSGGYVFEDMTVVGMAEIDEQFGMMNISEGEFAVTDWWDLF